MAVPVVSVAQMRQWESASWSAGVSEAEVIERVGREVARRARALTEPGQRVLLLGGAGHNGDDIRAALAHLPDRTVTRFDCKDPAADLGPLRMLLKPGPALVVDGLFGIGLNRPLSAAWQEMIQAVNDSGIPVLAMDVPSGLNADTGQAGGAAIQAVETLCVGAPKRGLLRTEAAGLVGRLWVTGDVGLRPWTAVPGLAATAQFWTEPGDFRTFLPRRRVTSHKGDFGHVVVIAGSRGYHGAAVLAARGALRARPGRVTVLTPPDVYPQVASQLAAAMVAPWSGDSPLPAGPSALLAGPGLAAADLPDSLRREVVRCWQEAPCPMVADASALDWLPPRNGAAPALRVITPHPGEAGRLLGMGATEVQQDRVGVVRRLSRRFGDCLVVLKGHQSLVGGAEGPLHVNSSGNPGLAQGGSGDVLGGYLAGLLGQPALQEIPSLTVRYGVWEHGATGDILEGERGNWTSEDLAEALGDARWD